MAFIHFQLRDTIKNYLLNSPFTKGVSLHNNWIIYGRAGYIKNTKFYFKDFKIIIKKDEIEYYLGFVLLGKIPISEYMIVPNVLNSKMKFMLGTILKQIRIHYSKNANQ